MADPELDERQRRLLELVYEHFDRELAWPERRLVQRRLVQRGQYDIEVEVLAEQLRPRFVYLEDSIGGEIRLMLRGFRAIYRTVEPQDFMSFLRLAVERYQAHDVATPTISTADLAQRYGMDARRIGKVDLLLRHEYFIARRSNRAPGDGPFEWTVDDSVWKYKDAYDIDRYLDLRAKHIEEQGRAPAPPVTLLASEGVPLPSSTPEVFEEAQRGEELRLTISDPELRRRCADILDSDGPFDRVVREACVVLEDRVRRTIGVGARLRGTALMEHAFGPKDGKLRFSDDSEVQRGVMELYRGTMAFFRNPTGHGLQDLPRDEAIRVVVLVDLLLGLLGRHDVGEGPPR